jgi:hypothetical protein
MYRIYADQSLRGHFIGREDRERAPSSKVLCACTAQEMEPAAARHVFQYVKRNTHHVRASTHNVRVSQQ